jgi:DUF1365 family protein
LVECVVAEVNNTPWGERHCYVLPARNGRRQANASNHKLDKQFHVSPFLPMDMEYRWRFVDPGASLQVHMENRKAGERIFDATLSMRRQEITGPGLARVLVRYPLITVKIIFRIHFQALRLWMKGAVFQTHPDKRDPTTDTTLESR